KADHRQNEHPNIVPKRYCIRDKNYSTVRLAVQTLRRLSVVHRIRALDNPGVKHSLTTQQGRLRHEGGLTLVELMVVIVLVAVIAMIATPSWRSLMARNAVRALTND